MDGGDKGNQLEAPGINQYPIPSHNLTESLQIGGKLN